jgi:ribosome biogenesis GTPase
MRTTELDLSALGWSAGRRAELESGLEPARVMAIHRGALDLFTATGVVRAQPPGRAEFELMDVAVGDWVGFADGAVRSVLPRRTALIRGTARSRRQTLVANIDLAFVVDSLATQVDLEWIERCLVAIGESGATPEVVLTKADRIDDPHPSIEHVEAVAPGVPVHVVSALSGAGCARLRGRIEPGATAVLLGSSGVGKSTLVNHLAGRELMATSKTGAGDQGRHTTSLRQLILLPGGGAIIDMPGLRELRLGRSAGAFDKAFSDIDDLTGECRFADCGHTNEPGCAVVAAVQSGALRPERLQSWRKFEGELRANAVSA